MEVKTAGWVLAAGMAVAMGAVAYTLLGGPVSEMGQTDSLEPVGLTLRGQTHDIPKAFLWYKPQWEGAAGDALHLSAIWPDMAPYGEATKAYFKGGMGLPYKIEIDLFAMTPGERIEDLYFRPGYLEGCSGGRDDGYLLCPHPRAAHLFDVLVRADGPRPLAVICQKGSVDRAPFCTVDVAYAEDLRLRVGFHRKRLPDAAEVVGRATSLLCGTRRAEGPPARACATP